MDMCDRLRHNIVRFSCAPASVHRKRKFGKFVCIRIEFCSNLSVCALSCTPCTSLSFHTGCIFVPQCIIFRGFLDNSACKMYELMSTVSDNLSLITGRINAINEWSQWAMANDLIDFTLTNILLLVHGGHCSRVAVGMVGGV